MYTRKKKCNQQLIFMNYAPFDTFLYEQWANARHETVDACFLEDVFFFVDDRIKNILKVMR